MGAGFGTTLFGIAGRVMLRQCPIDDVRLRQFQPRLDRRLKEFPTSTSCVEKEPG
jgi:hypothetical protein